MKIVLKSICTWVFFISFYTYAAIVDVEIRGKVDLDDFQCQTPSSPIIKMICYQEGKKYLLVKIKDSWTQYCEVDPITFKNFQAAGNMSKFFAENIKATFSCYH